MQIDDAPSTTTITLARLAELLKAESLLFALEVAGVDNWDGYSEKEPQRPIRDAIDAAVADGSLTPDFTL